MARQVTVLQEMTNENVEPQMPSTSSVVYMGTQDNQPPDMGSVSQKKIYKNRRQVGGLAVKLHIGSRNCKARFFR